MGAYWPLMTLAIIGFLLAAAAEAGFAKLFGDLIDQWDDPGYRASALIPLMMGGAAFVRAIGSIMGESLISRVSFWVIFNLRQELFLKLLDLPSSYYDANSQGHIVNRITFTVAQLREAGTDALKALIEDGLKVVVLLGALFWLNWKLTLVFIAAAPILALVVVFASNRFRRISRKIQGSMGDVTHVVSETVSGYREVKTFGGQEYEKSRFMDSNKVNRQQNNKMTDTRVLSAQINYTTVALALCGLIFLFYRPDLVGEVSAGDAVTFLALAGLLGRPIKKLSEVNSKLQRGLAASEDVFEQLDSRVQEDLGSIELKDPVGQLEIRNLTFGYQSSLPSVLKNINLTVEPGRTVALVGRSGSGKTTLASLIARFYDANEGEIRFDGIDLKEIALKSLRKQISVVSQQPTLFNDNLRNNIAYGELSGAEDAAIERAVDRAGAKDFIDALPDGLDTFVGDDGVLLSGGQRQRVAIARALLKDSPLLILDEATSALDNESERSIQLALEELTSNRTTIVIAHRLSTVESADQIIVLDKGEVIEKGNHTELIQQGGLYADLYASQFKEDLAEKPIEQAHQKPVNNNPRVGDLMDRATLGIERAWYNRSWWLQMLRPLSWIYGQFIRWRKNQLLVELKPGLVRKVPVIVVGNITVGGTGKTPFVGWLVEELSKLGYKPGVVLRGYGGRASGIASVLEKNAKPRDHGDEAVMLKNRYGCEVAVGHDRSGAAALLEKVGVDIIVSDDGLQHYALEREIEIAILDGERGLGNGLLLPAGPLREKVGRLDEVDWVVCNSRPLDLVREETVMYLAADGFINLETGESIDIAEMLHKHKRVKAVCGIGNPRRFLSSLGDLGFVVDPQIFKDHHEFVESDLVSEDEIPIVCTEKDAIKIQNLEISKANIFYLKVSVSMSSEASEKLVSLLSRREIEPLQRQDEVPKTKVN